MRFRVRLAAAIEREKPKRVRYVTFAAGPDRYSLRELIDRAEIGFRLPTADCPGGSLIEWGETLIDENHFREEGLFFPEPIRAKWREYHSGDRGRSSKLWAFLILQAWLALE